VAVDVDGDGIGLVPVDGSDSHTHGPDETLVRFVWKKGTSIIGTGEISTLSLSVGQHEISLTVTDSSGDQNTDTTVITVRPQSYPWVKSLSPTSGDLALLFSTERPLQFLTRLPLPLYPHFRV
jgi:hypothetical protein